MTEKSIRLDKWLWFARITKSRTRAQSLVRSGKVRLNKQKIDNPAKQVSGDDVLTITLERRIFVLKIVACGKRRGPYLEACKLYQDLTPEIETGKRQTGTSGSKFVGQPGHEKIPRPDKQGRRKLLQLKNRQYFQ
jgi:ribosome-associated heat shock protein Hsp15